MFLPLAKKQFQCDVWPSTATLCVGLALLACLSFLIESSEKRLLAHKWPKYLFIIKKSQNKDKKGAA